MNRRAVDALVVSLASRQGMVVTLRQLTDAGLARHEVRSRSGGLLTPVSAGVYVVGELTPSACPTPRSPPCLRLRYRTDRPVSATGSPCWCRRTTRSYWSP